MAIRKVIYEFVGDTSQLEGKFQDLREESEGLGGTFTETFDEKGAGGLLAMGKGAVKAHPMIAAVATAALAVGVAMVKATQATIEFAAKADLVAKKARAIGTDAESLQVLQGSLELGGVAAETTANAIQKLSVNLGMAVKGSKLQVEALDELGLSAQQLESVPLEERIALIADGLAGMTSQSVRAQTAQALLGRGALDMLAAFDQGGDAIRDSADKIRAAGIISNETAAESEALTDAVTIASKSWQRLTDGALEPLIPVVTVIVDKLAAMFQIVSSTGLLQALASSVAFVAEKFLGLTDEVERFKEETEDAASASAKLDEELRGKVKSQESYRKSVAALEKEEKALGIQIRTRAMFSGNSEKQSARLVVVEKELNMARIGLRIMTGNIARVEGDRAAAGRAAAAAALAAKEAEEDLAEARRKAAEKEAKRKVRRAAGAAEAKKNQGAAAALLQEWIKANDDARISQLEGIAKLNAEEKRANQEAMDRAEDLTDAIGISKAKEIEINAAAGQRILEIGKEFQRKRDELNASADKKEADRLKDRARAEAEFWKEQQETFEFYLGVQAKARENKEAKEAETRQATIDATIELGQTVLDVVSQAADAVFNERVDAMQATADRIKEIEDQLTEATTDAERQRLEANKAALQERSEQQKAEALEAWKRSQALAIVQAIVNTALAVISQIAGTPGPPGIVLGIAAGVAGAAAIATIAAQPAPQLHAGGMIPSVAPAAMASDEVMIRARRGEAVLSPQGVSAAGGAGGVNALNAGASTGPNVTVFQVGHRAVDAMVHESLRRPAGRLTRELRAVRPRRVGRHNPYRS